MSAFGRVKIDGVSKKTFRLVNTPLHSLVHSLQTGKEMKHLFFLHKKGTRLHDKWKFYLF